MFPRVKEPTPLENEITRVMHKLDSQEIGSDEYAKTLEMLVKLHKMKEDEKPDQVKFDTAATITANLVGILLIIRHEHLNVITSKAMDRVQRLK